MVEGKIKTFTTDSLFSVTTSNLTSGTDTITVKGAIDDLGGAQSADITYQYRLKGTDTWSTTDSQTFSSPQKLSKTITNLTPDSTYEARIVGNASDGDSDTGETLSVMTDFEPAAVTTNDATKIDEDGATLNATLDSLGSYEAVDVYFEYRPVETSTWKETGSVYMDQSGTVRKAVAGLEPETDYEFRAIAVKSEETVDAKSGEVKVGE